jgi:hypothetical protein
VAAYQFAIQPQRQGDGVLSDRNRAAMRHERHRHSGIASGVKIDGMGGTALHLHQL